MDDIEVREVMDGMRPPPPTLDPGAGIDHLIELMRGRHDAHECLLVDEDGRLVGVVDVAQMLRYLLRHDVGSSSAVEALAWHGAREARDLARPHSLFVRLRDPLRHALHSMLSHGTDRVPVVDDEDRPVGTLDLIDALATVWGERPGNGAPLG